MDPANWARYGYGPMMPPPPVVPYIEHQKAVTIRNDVNLKKETLKLEADEDNPGKFLVTFTFDATVPGRYKIPCFLVKFSIFIIHENSMIVALSMGWFWFKILHFECN